jgi:hypothetical protein
MGALKDGWSKGNLFFKVRDNIYQPLLVANFDRVSGQQFSNSLIELIETLASDYEIEISIFYWIYAPLMH